MDYINRKIEENINEIISVLQNFIKIDTQQDTPELNAPFGRGNKKALDYLISLAEKYGLKYYNMDNYLCWIEIGEGQEMLAFPVHLDVVPPGEGWSVNPFGAVQKDGYIYGRGAVDNKGPAVLMLFVLKFLQQNPKILLKKRVRVIFGTNEETGMECIKYYKAKGGEEPTMGFTPDAMYPVVIGEKGMIHINVRKKLEIDVKKPFIKLNGGEKSNVVPEKTQCLIYNLQNSEKAEIEKLRKIKDERFIFEDKNNEVYLKYNGQACHASNPEKGINSIAYMNEILSEINIDFNGKNEIKKFNDVIGKGYFGEKAQLNIEDKIFGKLTLNLGILKIQKDEIYGEIDIRYPKNITEKEILDRLQEKFGREYEIKKENGKPLHYVDKNTELVKRLMKVFVEETGRKEEYLVIGGGTYASQFKNIVGFGPKFKEIRTGGHGRDERISIQSLKDNLRIYYKAVLALLEN